FRNLIFEDVDISLDRYLYLFGPRVSLRPAERFRIFAQAMVGGVHDHSEITFTGVGGSVTNSSSADASAFDFGVGADWRFTDRSRIRPLSRLVKTRDPQLRMENLSLPRNRRRPDRSIRPAKGVSRRLSFLVVSNSGAGSRFLFTEADTLRPALRRLSGFCPRQSRYNHRAEELR